MSLPPVARRSLALVASTALLTSGLSALVAPSAFAANTATVTAVSPDKTNNSANTSLTVTGDNFNSVNQAGTDRVDFDLNDTSTSAYGSSHPTISMSVNQPDSPAPAGASTYSLSYTGTLATTNAAPGFYDVSFHNAGGNGPKCVKCFYIGESGVPDITSVTPGDNTKPAAGGTSRGANAINLNGRYLAQASKVALLLPSGGADPHASFVVGDPNQSGSFKGYASSSLIRGNYTEDAGFVPGRHLLQATNTLGHTGAAGDLYLPYFKDSSSVSPNNVGAGVTNKVITVTGAGIRQGSLLRVTAYSTPSDPSGLTDDVSYGPSTVSADGTQISVPVSFTNDADSTDLRDVTISGPDGGSYTVAKAFKVNAAPSITSISKYAFGQGANVNVTVTGTNFAVGTTAADRPVFTTPHAGVTLTTLSSTNVQATVNVAVAQDAPTGSDNIVVTNPDGGTTTFTGPQTSQSTPALTVNAGPKVTKVSPTSAAAGKTVTVTLTGTGFDNATNNPPTGKPTVQFSLPPAAGQQRTADSSVTVGTVTSTPANSATGAPATLSFPLTIAGNAPSGLRDITVTNPSDGGSFLCAGCFGVDSLTASPATGANSGTKTVTFTAGQTIPQGSTVRLTKAGDASVQSDIPGSAVTISGSTLTGTFDLTDAATGAYNGIVTLATGGTLSCSGCFTVTGPAPTFTSITPAGAGLGATNKAVTITGTNFSHGMQVAITDVVVHDVVFVSRTQLSAKVDVPSSAATGAKDVTITNNDASQKGTGTGAFTVSKPPTVSSISPTSYGQGAQGVKVTVTGPDLQDGATLDLGPGISVVGKPTVTQGMVIPVVAPDPNDTLVATVNIDPLAGAVQRDVTVTNPDGGVGTLAKGFTVNPGPVVTGVTPQFLAPGGSGKLTIAGSNFSTTSGKTAVPTIKGVTLSNVTVANDGKSITADAQVDNGTAKGPADVVVTNPTDSGTGTCASCFYVATPPGPPVQVRTTGVTDTSVTVAWTAPSDNGGAPITSYVVSAKDPNGLAAGTPATIGGGSTLTGTVTGLKTGVKYTISVIARNVAGDSTPSTTIAQTQGSATKTPTLTVSADHLNVGSSTTVVVLGTAGHAVQLAAESKPATTYTVVRNGTFNQNGAATFTIAPRTNTLLFAYDADAKIASNTLTVYVRPAESLRGSVAGKVGSFTGQTVPGHAGVQIRLYTVKNGRISGPVGTATTDANGRWSYRRSFAVTGPVTFISQSVTDSTNLSGQSNRVTLTFK